jgi:tetratricopeptide (TPR) repeat protein
VAAPPLTRSDEAAEGADVLAEVAGPTGVLLFHALRDFMLWVETPAGERRGLFPYGAGARRRDEVAAAMPEQELWAPLLTLAQMTDAPDAPDPGRLVYACRAVARWAERSRAPATRLAFVQAAALAMRTDPKLALETGRLARDLARHAAAERWLRIAIKLSRRTDWESYAWGFVGLGVLYIRTGNMPAAQAVMQRALRAGTKRRMRPVQGAAHHYLFNLLADGGKLREAYGHARAALQMHDVRSSSMISLAHDLGRYWLLQGCYARAATVFETIAPQMETPSLRMLATANLAQATAGAGDRAGYEAARARALAMAEEQTDGLRVAETLWLVAMADAEIREWERAEEMAGRSRMLARARGEGEFLMHAELLLEKIIQRRGREIPEPQKETAGSARYADRLAQEVVRTLSLAAA